MNGWGRPAPSPCPLQEARRDCPVRDCPLGSDHVPEGSRGPRSAGAVSAHADAARQTSLFPFAPPLTAHPFSPRETVPDRADEGATQAKTPPCPDRLRRRGTSAPALPPQRRGQRRQLVRRPGQPRETHVLMGLAVLGAPVAHAGGVAVQPASSARVMMPSMKAFFEGCQAEVKASVKTSFSFGTTSR